SRAEHFRHLYAETGIVVLKDGNLALADAPAVDHDLDRFADLPVERDRCALLEVHQARYLHPARSENDFDIDRNVHDQVEICRQRAARLLGGAGEGVIAEIIAAEVSTTEVSAAETGIF